MSPYFFFGFGGTAGGRPRRVFSFGGGCCIACSIAAIRIKVISTLCRTHHTLKRCFKVGLIRKLSCSSVRTCKTVHRQFGIGQTNFSRFGLDIG